MSGRRSKKNQKLGSSRRGARGLRVPEEKDNDECDNGQNEIHTTTDPNDNQSNGTALQAQSHQTDHQTSALDCSPHAGAQIHKDSDMEAELPERKQKIGSTRKRTDGFTNVRKFEIHDEMGTTEEYGEEQVTQTNTSVVKEEHISFAEDEQRNLHEHSTSLNVSSDLSQQFGGELAVPQNIMDTVSQSKEHNSIDHQEITSDSQNAESNMSNDAAMRQSAYSSDQEIQQVSTSGHKRKMGSTRKPLAGNRGKNLEGQEPLRNTPGEIWEAEVKSSSEPEFNMLEEMMQTWDDVKRNDSPTNTSSHTESEKAEELNVSSETETNIRSVAYSVFDPTQQLFEKNHKTPLLNKHRMEHKEESLHIQAIEDFTEQGFENQLEVQNGKTMISVDKEHSANETDLSDSSLYANYNLPNLLPVISLDSLLPEDCKPSCDVMTEIAVCSQFKINNEDSAVSFPEAEDVAESREIYVEKDTDDVSETLITCDVAVTEIVMDVKDFTEHCVDLQTLENESVDSKTEYETDKFEMIDQDDVKDYHNMTQIFINAKDKEEGESFIQCMSEENAEVEVLLKAKCPAFDRETETGDKYKVMEDFEESQHEMSSSLVVISDVTEHLANIQDNDIKSDLQTEKISSDNNLEAFNVSVNAKNISGVTDSGLVLQDTVTESSLEFDTISDFTEINIISQDFQEEDLNQIVHKEKISISVEKDAGPVKVLDSALMTSSSEKSKAESICKTTESQNLTKSHVEFQENAIDVENVPVEGDTKPHLEIQTAIEMFDSTIVKGGIKENVCEVDVFMKHVELVGDTVTEDRNMTIETDFLQNNMSTDTNQETSENVERASTVIDSGLVMQDAVPESFPESNAVSEKAEINIIPDDSQGKDSHPKLSPLVHNRKMGSTRRPLRGNKEKEQDFKKIEVDAEKEDTKSHPEIQDHNNVVDHMMQRMMDVKHTEEEETSETVKMAQQEHPSENKECHTEITVEQEQKCSSDISQIKDAPPLVESVDMETEREVGEENRDGETKNITVNDEDTKSEEIFSLEDINSEVTVTSLTRQELFIQTTDEEVYDIIQKGKDTYEAREEETFLSANTEHTAVNRRNEIEDAQSDSQSDLQTINPIQNRVLTEEENDKSSDMNLEQTEHAENVSAVTDSGVSFEDVVTVDSEESHTVHENISEISEDSQKEEMQSKLNPLFHKRKMGSTRRTLRGNTGQRKHKVFYDDSDTFNIETLINEEKDDEREIHIEKDADSGEMLDSEESTAESICDITASQNLIKSHAEFQENAGDVEKVPVEGNTKTHLEIQTEIEMFDSTIVAEGIKEKVCEVDVLMKQVEFVGDTVTVDSKMTTETDFFQNNTTINTNQEMLKASKSFDSVCSVADSVIESFPESNTIYEKNKISIIPEDSQREDLHPKLSPVVHKRKMGSTRRPLRGNKEKEQDLKEKKEDTEPHSEVQDQNNVVDQNIKIEKVMAVGHNEEEENSRTCEHPSENKKCHREITLEQEQRSSPNIFQTQTEPSQHDADQNLPVVLESTSEFKDKPLVLSDDMFMEESQVTESSEPVLMVDSPQTESEEIYSASSRSLPKRKMGSTRKTLRGRKMENKRDFGEEKEGEMDEETTDLKETFTLEEAISLTTTETQVHQTPLRLDLNIEAHDIQDTGNKPDKHTENPEQAKIFVNEQNDPISYTNQGPSEYSDNVTVSSLVTISAEFHKEEIQSKLNPVAQRRKMGSTRKTLRGNNGQRRREIESKNMDGDSESELKSDENTQFKEPTSFERVVQPETIPKIFFKPEDEVKKVINSQSNEVPLEAYTITDLESKMLVCAPDPKVGEKNYLECSEPSGSSESEKSDKSRRSLEVESDTFQIGDNQLQLTVSDQSHQVLSEKHPQTETVTVRKKMSSTRKNFRGKRGESDGNLEQTDDSLLNEIEKELNKSSQSSQNVDYQVMINEPNSGNLSVETSHLNTPENSKPEHKSNKDNFTSPQVTKSQRSESPSELSSPGRRRKMGSTRKNPRHQVKREDDNDEMGEKYKQGPRVSKKDLETAEESKECDITNKEYLDIPIALTSSCELEENAASVMPESTSPSTKRKFGSRRTNMSRSGLVISEGGNEIEKGEHTPDSSEVHQHSDDIMVHDSCLSLRTENQPIIQPISEYGNMEIRSKEHVPCAPTKPTDTAAGLVSLDQIIKAGQHDRSPGKTQAADLKNISDMEAIQFNVVMVGNSCVGKTSFIRRFHAGQFSLDYCSTIGVDTCVHNVVLDDKVVKLHIWDTAGQERFHSITTQVFHRADSLLIMYEITSSKSFISVRDWISQVQEKARDDVIILLLGNKSDCAEREVQVQEGEALAREYNISFMECSAATGQNVSECIKSLAELLVQQKNQKMEKYTVLKREQPQKKSGCC